MKRFLVFALVGALSLAGSTGLAFGQKADPKSGPNSKATIVHPLASPGKHPPSKSPPQIKKPSPQAKKSHPQAHRTPAQAGKSTNPRAAVGKAPKHGQQPLAKKGPDWGKVGTGVMEGVFGTAAGISAVEGGVEAVTTAPTVVGAIPGAVLAGVEGAAAVKEFADSARDITEGLEVNDTQKSNQGPAKPKNGAQKSNPRPAKPKSEGGR
jgi:hypothetical protein